MIEITRVRRHTRSNGRAARTVAAGLTLLLVAAIVAVIGPRQTFPPNLGRSSTEPNREALPAGKSVTVSDIDPSVVRVPDGDTVRLYGAKPDYRLVGFNAPETGRPACDAEAQLGAKATRRLRDIVAAGGLTMERVACACPAGTEGPTGATSAATAARCGLVAAMSGTC